MLITGRDTPLGGELTDRALAAGFAVVATVNSLPKKKSAPRGKDDGERKAEPDALLLLPWTRPSALSAQNVILRALKAHDSLDHAVVVVDGGAESRALHELPAAKVQEIIDAQLKGHVFLIKEVLHLFLRRRAGTLSLVLHAGGAEAPSALDSMTTASFLALARSMMSTYQNEPIAINGFETASSADSAYAGYVIRAIKGGSRTSGGKWHRFNDRAGLRGLGFRKKG